MAPIQEPGRRLGNDGCGRSVDRSLNRRDSQLGILWHFTLVEGETIDIQHRVDLDRSVREVPPGSGQYVLMPVFSYAIGILIWFIPYTLLAIGLWIWSRNKSVTALFKAAMASPVIFGVLMLLEGLLVNLPASDLAQLGRELPGQVAMLGGLSLLFGYFCVGIAWGIFKILKARKFIAEETPAPAAG